MKKFLLVACLSLGFISITAEAALVNEHTVEVGRRGGHHHGRYNHGYYKGNMDVCDLPNNITKYLNKYYGDYDVMVAKRNKANGYYYLKISYGGNSHRPYYRSLVFDEKGRAVKG